MKILVEEGAGYFDVILVRQQPDEREIRERYHFDQEDTHEELTKVFRNLGFETEYHEVC